MSMPATDVYIIGTCDVKTFGLTQLERLRRGLKGLNVRFHHSFDDPPQSTRVLVILANWVLESRLLRSLAADKHKILRQPSPAGPTYVAAYVPAERLKDAIRLLTDQPKTPSAWLDSIETGDAGMIAGRFEGTLRKREPPVACGLSAATRDDVERDLFRSSYKGATDFVTKYLWPVPAFHVVRVLAAWGVSPNIVTWLSLLCVVLTFILFGMGFFWQGLASAYLMAFLDTVDGKLARVTVSSSRIGHLLDHGIDLISPPFWWAAWFGGVLGGAYAHTAVFERWGLLAFWSIMVLYWLVRGVEALFVVRFNFYIHIWKPVDFGFRLVTTRRNPNLVILTIGMLAGRPDLGFIAVAVWAWISFAFHSTRFGQALAQQARGKVVRSWLEDKAVPEQS